MLSQSPYLSRSQSCPSFLPGAWALADSCNPWDLLVWPALHCMPAAEALLPACLSWGPGKGREILSRPLLPVSGSCSPWEKPADHRGQICFLPTSSSVRRQVQSKARARNPSHLVWMPRCWQLRARTWPAQEIVGPQVKMELGQSYTTRMICLPSKNPLL